MDKNKLKASTVNCESFFLNNIKRYEIFYYFNQRPNVSRNVLRHLLFAYDLNVVGKKNPTQPTYRLYDRIMIVLAPGQREVTLCSRPNSTCHRTAVVYDQLYMSSSAEQANCILR